MADDLSLLFRLRGDASGAKVAANDARQAIHQLRQSAATDFKAIQTASTSSLGSITQTAGQLTQGIPVVGRAVSTLSQAFTSLTTATTAAGAGFAGMAGPIGIAVAGIVATAAAVGKLGVELFDLAKATADFQGKLFDLNQQTGISVETLSALDVVARTTGSSVERLAASLGIFQKNMEESLDPTSKQAEAFKRLGVTVTDTEQTFRDTLQALSRMPEGFRQTALALELFGRGGKSVLAILKETQGDLDGTIEKLRGMGLVTTEQARKADEFNDQLVLLEVALRGLGTDAIPLITDALKFLNSTLKDNRDAFKALQTAVEALTLLFVAPLRGAVFAANAVWKSHAAEIGLLIEAYQILKGVIHDTVAEIPVQPTTNAPTSGQELLKELQRFGAGKQFPTGRFISPTDIPEGLVKSTKKAGAVDEGVQLLKQLERELRNLNDATRAEEVAAELLEKRFAKVNPLVKERILLTAQLIDTKRAQDAVDKEIEETEKRQEAERLAAAKQLSAFLQQQADDLRDARGETKTSLQEAERFIRELGSALDDVEKSQLRFNARIIDTIKLLTELNESLLPAVPVFGGELEKQLDTLPDAPKMEQPIRNLNDAFKELGITITDTFGVSKEAGAEFSNVVSGALTDMTFAIGDLVNQWVLLGNTGPNAMRKLTASVLAGLAAQAAVKAIFQLAEGFAALFFNPAAAAAHFKSAALFGAVAVAAGAAGRAIAGNAFSGSGAGAGGAAGVGGGGQLNPLTLNRNQTEPRRIIIEFRADDSKFGQAITAHVVQDITNAGPIRETINNDGNHA